VAAVLESLCRKDASGVLEVDGNPAGAIYLDRGRITFARSSWAPDLTARLCGVLRPSPELRNFLRGSDQAESNSGALLVRRGYMSENDLRSILRSAVIDALIVLTMPLVDESSVLDIRFEAPSAHWAAAFLRLPLESVQSDVTRRAAQMASAGVAHTAPVTLSDLDRPAAVLTRTQWAIASRVDGTLSPRDLARQSGLSLYETVTSLGALIRRGLCAPATLGSPAVRPVPRPLVASAPPAATPTTPLPPDTVSRLITRAAPPATRRPVPATFAPGSPDSSDLAPVLPARPAAQHSDPLTHPGPAQPAPDRSDPLTRPAQPAPAHSDPLTRPAAAALAHSDPPARPAAAAQPAAPTAVPPVRSAPDAAALERPSDTASLSRPSDDVTPADPAVPAARASWTDAAAPVGRTPWSADAAAPVGRTPWPTPATSAAFDTPVSRATWTGGATSAAGDSNGPPPERRSFTPAATPTPSTSPRPSAAPVPSGATPPPPGPGVNPAGANVPPGHPDLPSYSDYRRPTRRPWPQSEAPVPPATLAARTPADPPPASTRREPPAGHLPAGHTPAGGTPTAPDPEAQPPAPTWREAPASYPTRVPQSSRPARGAHRADRPLRPEATRRSDHEASRSEAPELPPGLPARRRPVNLPQRQPGRISTGDQYTANAARSYTAAQARPVPAEDWSQPSSFGRPAEAAYTSDHPSAPLPVTPAAPSPSRGGAESEDFTPAAPDLLRRVLDGLRRLA
jgi:hypothetical protein